MCVMIISVKDCKAAAASLERQFANQPNAGKVFYTKCDVSDQKSVMALGQFAQKNLGTIGYWINNAGINGGRRDLRDVTMNTVEAVVKVGPTKQQQQQQQYICNTTIFCNITEPILETSTHSVFSNL